MYVCMYACMYVYMYVCMYVRIHTHTHTHSHTHTHIHTIHPFFYIYHTQRDVPEQSPRGPSCRRFRRVPLLPRAPCTAQPCARAHRGPGVRAACTLAATRAVHAQTHTHTVLLETDTCAHVACIDAGTRTDMRVCCVCARARAYTHTQQIHTHRKHTHTHTTPTRTAYTATQHTPAQA